MTEKILKTRLRQKIDTEAHWNLAETFTPLKGEFIIYDVDDDHVTTRLKIGNGIQTVTQLPFMPFSAYDIAKAKGFEGSEEQWLDSLKGRGIKEIGKKQASVGSNGETEITIKLTDNSTETFKVYNGEKGEPGRQGDQGVGIASINAIPSDDNTHTDIQISFSDNSDPVNFTVQNGVVTDDQLDQIQEGIVDNIQLKCQTHIFQDYEELENALVGENRDEEFLLSLNDGDVFLIRDIDVPDFWWEKEKTQNVATFNLTRTNYEPEIIVRGFGVARILETQKTDLSNYLELDKGPSNTSGQGIKDLSGYKLRVGAAGDTGLEHYITFILEE